MFQLVGSQQVLTELVTQVDVDFVETALALHELLEVHVDVLPLGVLLLGLLLEISEEVALHLLLVICYVENYVVFMLDITDI